MNPTKLTNQIENDFPGIWARIDKAQPLGKLLNFPVVTESASRIYPRGTKHPSGYPLSYLMSTEKKPENRAAFREIVERGVDADSIFVAYSEDALQGVAAWRTTRLHYEFNPDFYDALSSTPLKGTPPSQIFEHLPAKAFFMSRRGGVIIDGDDTPCHGFFVTVFSDKLLMIPLSGNSVTSGKFLIKLNQESVESALDRVCNEGLESSIRVIEGHPVGTDFEKSKAIEQTQKDWIKHETRLRDTWCGALSCLMYLCTEAPDIEHKKPPPVKTIHLGGRTRFIPPKQETTIAVGARLGILFQKNVNSDNSDFSEVNNRGSGCLMPPHIRRAHWHTYWVGKKSEQKPELKWLSPILVNAESSDKLTETIHRVQSERSINE